MKLFFYITLFFNLSLVFAQQATGLELTPNDHEFGDITQGDQVTMVVGVKNTSLSPLLINDIQVQCGCTTTEKPKEAILPGEKIDIKVDFDSTGKEGFIRKSITFVSNQGNVVFVFTANIIE